MGPITLFDKSFFQSLSLDEAVWFDNFFLTNVCPIFFFETLADLDKTVRSERTPEMEVRIIADKTPEMHSSPNIFHLPLSLASLQGNETPMDGRIVLPGGTPIKTADQKGFLFKIPPEMEALRRWQEGEFLIVERQFARAWRRMLRRADYEFVLQRLNSIGIDANTCKTREDAKAIAESIINASDYSFDRIKLVLSLLNVPIKLFIPIFHRWGLKGFPSMKTFAPYAAHIFEIEIFFFIAAASNLISRKDITDKIDLAYLFYLPFCMIFVSSDHIHRRCAPLFMRTDQEFIWGWDLKDDLKRINQYFDRLPTTEKEKGLYSFATWPPSDGDFLLTKLWDRFLPLWRQMSSKENVPNTPAKNQGVDHWKRFFESKPLRAEEIDFDVSNPDAMILEKKVKKRRGNWYQLPRDLKVNKN